MARILTWVLGLPLRLKQWAVVAAIVVAAALVVVHAIRRDAVQDERARVERQNEEAVEAADAAADAVHDCLDSGGVYDQPTGECRR